CHALLLYYFVISIVLRLAPLLFLLFPYTTLFRSPQVFLVCPYPGSPVCLYPGSLVSLCPGSLVSLCPGSPVYLYLGSPVCLYPGDRKSTRLNSSHVSNSYAVFCLKQRTQLIRCPQ